MIMKGSYSKYLDKDKILTYDIMVCCHDKYNRGNSREEALNELHRRVELIPCNGLTLTKSETEESLYDGYHCVIARCQYKQLPITEVVI